MEIIFFILMNIGGFLGIGILLNTLIKIEHYKNKSSSLFTLGAICFSLLAFGTLILTSTLIEKPREGIIDKVVADTQDKRDLIEDIYTEFKEWEFQQSFAGKTVQVMNKGDDTYYMYITNGSGIRIIQAVCFKTNSNNEVSQVGIYKTDGNKNYELELNPETCEKNI